MRKIESFSLEIFMILLDSVSYRCRYPSWNAESTMKIFMLYKLKFYYRVSEKIAGKLRRKGWIIYELRDFGDFLIFFRWILLVH